MNIDKIDFATYCIGLVAERMSINQPTAYRMLRTSGIIENYIIPGYDVLHTFGSDYLAEDLIQTMKEKNII